MLVVCVRRRSRASSISSAQPRKRTLPRCLRKRSLAPGRCRCGRRRIPPCPASTCPWLLDSSAVGDTEQLRASRRRSRSTTSSLTFSQLLAKPEAQPESGPEIAPPTTARRVFGLALPALGVLAAEPLYLLFDVAVVGRLGALPLAGLAVGGLILAMVSTQLTFLSYGTTARSSRRYGAGDRSGAVTEGVQATWLAVIVGLILVAAVQMFAAPIVGVIAGDSDIADAAVGWLRIAIFGVPLILISMAGNGWMRGVQNTIRPLRFVVAGLGLSAVLCPMLVHGLWGAPRMELDGSAVANVVGQSLTAALFVGALVAEKAPLRPQATIMLAQVVMGRDLILRSLAFQACFVSAAAVAARFGAAAVAAHQVVLHLWNLVALTLDSLAIAAQTLIGAALGGGRSAAARQLARQITVWSTGFAVWLAVLFAAGHHVMPRLFTSDADVLGQMGSAWWF
ncbi:MAG: MATE family efflux transporter, partial [Rhodococcus sp.]|nr:MATE family efflux transporter [Rhodococcus sp. (in: high G+C Gram-positive bacteria)]